MTLRSPAAFAAALLLVSAPSARAQIFETVGTRAQGMGGAFVAVADDSTATWWNPAGLATGAYFSSVAERGLTSQPAVPAGTGPAWRGRLSGFSIAYPAMGFSYYRLRISEIRPSSTTADAQPGREDQGPSEADLRSLATTQFGLTIGQSLGGGLVLGSTLKLIRGGVAESTGASGSDLLDQADDLDHATETHTDIDVGAMLSAGHLRFGASVKHLTKPEFGNGDRRVVLDRQARAGVAIITGAHSTLSSLIVAFDGDLTKTATATGDVQHLAGGVEGWFYKRRIGLRGGLSHSIEGPSVTSKSGGISLAVKSSTYLDGALVTGSDESLKGWSLAIRSTF